MSILRSFFQYAFLLIGLYYWGKALLLQFKAKPWHDPQVRNKETHLIYLRGGLFMFLMVLVDGSVTIQMKIFAGIGLTGIVFLSYLVTSSLRER